ncbi:MAG TPA: S9 family peptidase [Dongiaceae bacterium]|nr:S9 family peptidase [Dongiaceae bacterium]
MRHRIVRSLLCVAVACEGAWFAAPAAAAAAATAPIAAWKWTPEVLADLVDIKASAISPDGRQVVYAATRPRGDGAPPGEAYANLELVGTEEAGRRVRRLTSADGVDDLPAWSPDGGAVAFLSERGGADAKTRLYVIPVDGGEVVALSPDDRDVSLFAWSRDGARLAYVARDPKDPKQDAVVVGRDDRPRRLYVVDRLGGAPRKVTALGDRSAWQIAWSPDGRSIAVAVSLGAMTDESYLEKRIVILPVAGGVAEHEVAPKVGKIHEIAWTPDGTRLVWNGGVDRSDPTFGSVFTAPAAGGTPINLTGDRPETVRDLVAVSAKGVVVAATQGTGAALVEIDFVGGGRRDLLAAGRLAFTEASASEDGTRFAIAGSTPSDPREISLVERGRTRRLTDLHAAVAGFPRARQEVVRWRASDGLEIEGILQHPASVDRSAPAPIVVIAHGGPEYEDLDGFDTTASEPAQALAERGFWVLRANYRGSTGRGVRFAKSDHGDLGGRDFLDIVEGIDALAARLPIDRARVGLLGGSYGGYFANLAATRDSARFAAVVSLFGIADWTSFLGQSDIPVENSEVHWALWCWEGKNHERCRMASPVTYAERAKTPTLILQGAADERVPKAQSDEMYAALTWAKAPVEYVVYPREKHGFEERAHRIDAARRILEWFEKHLAP